VLARHEYRKLCQRFRHGNQSLVEKVQPVQPGFTFDEGSQPEGLVFRTDLDNKGSDRPGDLSHAPQGKTRLGALVVLI
jgi:hypothetical protein